MHLHEYQAKILLSKYGIPIPAFAVISSLKEAEEAIEQLQLESAVVKVQIHAGGRGKAGGVKLAHSQEEILAAVKQLLRMRIVNNQTGPEGVVAHELLLTKLIPFRQEYYVAATIDRKQGCATLILSPEGGVEIEEVAVKHPTRILKQPLRIGGNLRSYELVKLVKFMGWSGSLADQGKDFFAGIAKAFMESDAALLEINPLVATAEEELWALDAKLTIDDNALYRHPEYAAFDDPTQLNPREFLAKQCGLAYIPLNGNIGCMVNGAGLAMATMDLIHHFGGKPANFLDVGGGASQDKIAEGFKILLSDHQVKAVLVNIFGGIMNCATLASALISVTQEMQPKVPIIVRLEGTNVEEAKQLLKAASLHIVLAHSLNEAAQKSLEAADGHSR